MATKGGQSYGKMCCLFRLDGKCGTQLVVLEGEIKTQITMGRQKCNDYVLEESPTVSRKHVIFEKTVDGWTIADAGSSHGVWVNQVHIDSAQLLKDKDIVEIGVDPQSGQRNVYRYRFYAKAHVKRKAEVMNTSGELSLSPNSKDHPEDVPRLKRLCREITLSTEQLRQRMRDQERRLQEEFGEKERELSEKQEAAEDALKEMRAQLEHKAQEQTELEQRVAQQEAMERALEEMREELALKAVEQEKLQKTIAEQQAEVQAQLEAKERAVQKAVEATVDAIKSSRKIREQAELEERRAQQAVLEELRQELALKAAEEEKLQKAMEERQAEVKMQIEAKDSAIEEAVTMRLELEVKAAEQEKLRKMVEEKQAEVHAQQEARQQQEEEAQNLREALKKEQETMQMQLGTLKTEVEEGKKQQEAIKEKIITSVEDAMEDELVCAICAELLIQATSLNCSHSFCSYCIQKWMLRKKECPNCRKPITSVVPSLVLDNYINKVVTFLGEELRNHRKEFIIARKVEQEQFEREQAADVVVIDDVPPFVIPNVHLQARAPIDLTGLRPLLGQTQGHNLNNRLVQQPRPAAAQQPRPAPVQQPRPAPVQQPRPAPAQQPRPAPVQQPRPAAAQPRAPNSQPNHQAQPSHTAMLGAQARPAYRIHYEQGQQYNPNHGHPAAYGNGNRARANTRDGATRHHGRGREDRRRPEQGGRRHDRHRY